MDSIPLFLQLWSLRREASTDPAATLHSVRSLGYDGVELAGDYGWSSDQWRALLDETGLKAVSAHVGLEALEADLAGRVAFHRTLGIERLIVPHLGEDFRTTDGYRDVARRLDTLGGKLAEEGLSIGSHNHDFEFAPLGDSGEPCGMEILLAETDAARVKFEFDAYWLEYAGRDALAFIRQHEDRVFSIHAKDLRKRDRADVPAGQGDVDFRNLLPLCVARDWPVIVEYEGENAPAAVREAAVFLRPLLG